MSRKNRPILVTGGAGYIGSVLTGLLLASGRRVRVLDRLSFGDESLVQFRDNPDFELLTGDIRDQSIVESAVAGASAVIHLAAIVGEPACNQNETEARSVNTEGSHRLFDAATKAGVERFVFASTCSNYGRMKDREAIVDETAELQPLSVYSETKVAFEQYLLNRSHEGINPTCLRFATAYGMSYRPRFDLTVNEFTCQLALGRKLEVYGEQFWRPYCHVRDIARACLTVLEVPSEKVSGKAFNVGNSEENYQKKKLVELIEQELPGCGRLVSYVEKEHDLRDYRVSFEKISRTLGYQITATVPDGIREIVAAITSGNPTDPDNPRYRNV